MSAYVDPEAKECGFMGCGRPQCAYLCNPTPQGEAMNQFEQLLWEFFCAGAQVRVDNPDITYTQAKQAFLAKREEMLP